MKRKYREAMRAAARERDQGQDDDAKEVRDWFDEWALTPTPKETNENQRSQE